VVLALVTVCSLQASEADAQQKHGWVGSRRPQTPPGGYPDKPTWVGREPRIPMIGKGGQPALRGFASGIRPVRVPANTGKLVLSAADGARLRPKAPVTVQLGKVDGWSMFAKVAQGGEMGLYLSLPYKVGRFAPGSGDALSRKRWVKALGPIGRSLTRSVKRNERAIKHDVTLLSSSSTPSSTLDVLGRIDTRLQTVYHTNIDERRTAPKLQRLINQSAASLDSLRAQ
jgi:hypothetical protein